MSSRNLTQTSIHDPEFVDPDCLEPGTVPWLLARYRSLLFPPWLFQGWRGEKRRGRPAWPATVLVSLLILRWTGEGMSRRKSIKVAKRNTTWRAAMGLPMGGKKTPTEKTVREFERFLRRRHPDADVPRYVVLHEHLVRTCLDLGVAGEGAIWAMDSTPMWCFGAVKDTVRLLGDGLRSLCGEFARLTKTPVEVLAKECGLELLLAKSTKGAFAIEWRDRKQRVAVIESLASQAIEVVQAVRQQLPAIRPGKRKKLLRRCRHLLKVVRNDLEVDETGRLGVAHRVARDRLVSLTDPQARHGRKSRSKTFNGFKAHVLGDVVSGLIMSLTVTVGNKHDGSPAPRLIRRARNLCDEIEQVLADTAYGGARLRSIVRRGEGVELLSPPPPVTRRKDKLSRQDIAIDFESWTATCANGITTNHLEWAPSKDHGVSVPVFRWQDEACAACPLHDACCGKRKSGNRVKLHPYEQDLRAAREAWKRPEVRKEYRKRSECERLVHLVTRYGGRQARAWGLNSANLQAHVIAMRSNLGMLAKRLAEMEELKKAKAA